MMGKKTLREIREEVQTAFAESDDDTGEWLERELRKLRRRRKPNQGEIDTLLLLRDALAAAKPRGKS